MRIKTGYAHICCLPLGEERDKFAPVKKLVMPVISLQIPVSELLETIRHLLANGKEVRQELFRLVLENPPVHSVDDSTSKIQHSKTNIRV